MAQPESHTHHGGVCFAAFHCLHCKLVGFLIQPNRHTTGIICAAQVATQPCLTPLTPQSVTPLRATRTQPIPLSPCMLDTAQPQWDHKLHTSPQLATQSQVTPGVGTVTCDYDCMSPYVTLIRVKRPGGTAASFPGDSLRDALTDATAVLCGTES